MDHFLENEMSTPCPPIDSALVLAIKLSWEGCLEPGSWQALPGLMHTQLILPHTHACALSCPTATVKMGQQRVKREETGSADKSLAHAFSESTSERWQMVPPIISTHCSQLSGESNWWDTLSWKVMRLPLASQTHRIFMAGWMLEPDPLEGDYPPTWLRHVRF